MRSNYLLLTLVTLGTVGCGGGPFDFAPVEGVVTLDGQPVEGAIVRFISQARTEDNLQGPSSYGMTDADGHFTLKTEHGDRGAVVGTHNVAISTKQAKLVDPTKSDEIEVIAEERIPTRYRSGQQLPFEVPSSGTKEATFSLTTK